VHFDLPPVVPETYAQITGPRGRSRRHAQRKQAKTKANAPKPAPASPSSPPRRRGTRKRKPTAKARAALSQALPAGNDLPQEHWACHGTAINPDTGNVAEYKELINCSDKEHWQYSNTDEIGRMFQGLGPDSYMPTGTNTLWFIDRKKIPKQKKPTYVRVVCADRPEKSNTRRVRWTAGGDRIVYPGNKTTKTADISTCKLMFNSVISTPNGRFMTIDLKDFFLCSDLVDYEYVRIPRHMLPDAIISLYNLEPLISNDYVYAQVRKGMYGLPQAGKLANDALVKYLAPHGFIPCSVTPGLWRDTASDLMFTLVVDDFGVRYTDKANVDRLLNVLQQEYKCSTDWTGNRYVGLTLDWDYQNGTCDISMPGYIARALSRFDHPTPTKKQHSPHPWNAPDYGSRQQFAQHDNTPFVDAKHKLRLQEVLGTLLYYGRAVDGTMIPAIGTIATQQATPTQATMRDLTQLLNYCATHPNAIVRYTKSDMHLWVESDASYLSETKARSRYGGYHYLSSKPLDPSKPPTADAPQPRLNGPINIPAKILREVVSSAAESGTWRTLL
jgi:hypothetical protein